MLGLLRETPCSSCLELLKSARGRAGARAKSGSSDSGADDTRPNTDLGIATVALASRSCRCA